MRKELLILFLIVLLSFVAVGQGEGDSGTDSGTGTGGGSVTGSDSGTGTGEDSGASGASGSGKPVDLKEALSGLNGSLDTSGVKSKTNDVLAKEILVPESWKVPARIVFGLKADDPVDLQTFIVLVAIWFGCLIFMKYFVEIMPIIREGSGLRQWFGAVVITLLIAVSGGLLVAADFFSDLGNLFGLVRGWGVLTTALAVIIAFVIVYIFSFVTAWLKSKTGEAGAFRMGEILKRLFTTAKISQEPV